MIIEWSKEVLLDREDDGLLQKLIAHKELLSGSRDISVAVLDSHTGESGLLDLKSHTLGQIKVDLSLFRWMDSWIGGGGPDVKSLVSYLIHHCFY